jgi:LEA14-like dessication related protein
MKKHSKTWMLLAGLALLVLGGCALPLEPRFERVSEFKPHGAQDDKPAGISLGLDLHNPNAYKIKLLRYDLDIFVNGNKVGDAERREKQTLAGNGTSTLHFELATDLKQVFSGLLGALGGLLGKDQAVVVSAKGTVLARAKGIQKLVPVDFEKRYELGK